MICVLALDVTHRFWNIHEHLASQNDFIRSTAWAVVDATLKRTLVAASGGGKKSISADERAQRFSLKTFRSLADDKQSEHGSWGSCVACSQDSVAIALLGITDLKGTGTYCLSFMCDRALVSICLCACGLCVAVVHAIAYWLPMTHCCVRVIIFCCLFLLT